jgi:hypothetical protein
MKASQKGLGLLPRDEGKKIFMHINNVSENACGSVRVECQKVVESLVVTAEVVRAAYKRWKQHPECEHAGRLFTDNEELCLVAELDAHSLQHTPLSKEEFLSLVKRLHPDRKDQSLLGWYRGFMDRWKNKLCTRAADGLSESRISPDTLASVEDWVEAWPSYLKKNGLSEKFIVNADETRLSLTKSGFKQKLITGRHGFKSSRKEIRAGKNATYLPFVMSTGQVLMDVFILPLSPTKGARFNVERIKKPSRNTHPTYWAFTDSGYMNRELWIECLQELKKIMHQVQPGVQFIVLTDNAYCHSSIETLAWCVENKVTSSSFHPM